MQAAAARSGGARRVATPAAGPITARPPPLLLGRRWRATAAAAAGADADAAPSPAQTPPRPSNSSRSRSRSRSRSSSRGRGKGGAGGGSNTNDPPHQQQNSHSPQYATAALQRAVLPRNLLAAWQRYGDATNPRHIAAATKRVAVMAPEALQRAHEWRRQQQQRQQREQQQQGGQRSRSRSRSRESRPGTATASPSRVLDAELRALAAVAAAAAGAALSLGERAQGGPDDGALVSVACALAGVRVALQKAETQGFLRPQHDGGESGESGGESHHDATTTDPAKHLPELMAVSLAHVSDALLPRLPHLSPRSLQQALWALASLAQPPARAQLAANASSAEPPPQPQPQLAPAAAASAVVSAPLDADPYDVSAPAPPHPAPVSTAVRGAAVASSYPRAGEWLRALEAASAQQLRASAEQAAAAAEAAAAAFASSSNGRASSSAIEPSSSSSSSSSWSHSSIISLPSLAQMAASFVRLGYSPGPEWWDAFWQATRPALAAAAAAGAAGAAAPGSSAPASPALLDPSLVQELLGGPQRTPASRAADVSRIVHAAARLGQRPPMVAASERRRPRSSSPNNNNKQQQQQPWLDVFLDASCASLPYSGAEDLTRTVWSLGVLGARPHRAWLMLFFLVSRRAMQQPASARSAPCDGGAPPPPRSAGSRALPGDLALWLQALARLGYTPSPAWLGDYVAATYPHLAAAAAGGSEAQGEDEGEEDDEAAVAAGSRPQPPRRRRRRRRQAPPPNNPHHMAPADVANLAWAAAAMGWQPPWRYWLAVLEALRAALPSLAPRDVASAAWAVGRLAGNGGGDGGDVATLLPTSWQVAAEEQQQQQQQEEREQVEEQQRERGGKDEDEEDEDEDEGDATAPALLPNGWLSDFCRLSAPALASMSGRELALTARALASLGAQPGPAWLGPLADSAALQLAHGRMGAAECRALAAATARMALKPVPAALLRLQAELLRVAAEQKGEEQGTAAAASAARVGNDGKKSQGRARRKTAAATTPAVEVL
jgi:hypothetical protein